MSSHLFLFENQLFLSLILAMLFDNSQNLLIMPILAKLHQLQMASLTKTATIGYG